MPTFLQAQLGHTQVVYVNLTAPATCDTLDIHEQPEESLTHLTHFCVVTLLIHASFFP